MSDTTAVNQAYFNDLASKYDEKFQDVTRRLEEEIRSRAHLLGARSGGRLLDYACGTGLLSRALGPQIGQCVGIDISEAMVEQYNAGRKREGLETGKCVAYAGNLVTTDESYQTAFLSAKFFNFDHAGVGLGFHHMDDCALAAKRLAQRLRPGGVLFVVDFAAQNISSASDEVFSLLSPGVRHQGFTEQHMRHIFDGAGVGVNFAFHVLDRNIMFEHTHSKEKHMARRVFIARGEKGE
ncbi:hypothetical protein E4U21_003124 [Claviceps maximensis]|nr:hypothetical protein E4U21_003124 [Claviceps maximensis]